MQYIVKEKVLCSAEKSSVILAEPSSRSSASQFGWSLHCPTHYEIVALASFEVGS
jgi:hypothetical protein